MKSTLTTPFAEEPIAEAAFQKPKLREDIDRMHRCSGAAAGCEPRLRAASRRDLRGAVSLTLVGNQKKKLWHILERSPMRIL